MGAPSQTLVGTTAMSMPSPGPLMDNTWHRGVMISRSRSGIPVVVTRLLSLQDILHTSLLLHGHPMDTLSHPQTIVVESRTGRHSVVTRLQHLPVMRVASTPSPGLRTTAILLQEVTINGLKPGRHSVVKNSHNSLGILT